MRRRFSDDSGAVVYIEVDEVKFNYPTGTLKVEVKFYPAGPGSYSAFIYTAESLQKIESITSDLAGEFLGKGFKSLGAKEMSDVISRYLRPVFPMR